MTLQRKEFMKHLSSRDSYQKLITLFLSGILFCNSSFAYIPYGYSGFTNPVTSSATLPLMGNLPGDVRVDLTAFNIYVWNGSSWNCASCGGGGGGGVTSYNGLTGAVSSRATTNTVSSNTTIPTLTNFYLLNVDTSSGPLNITLPDAVASNGFCVKIKNIGNPVHTNTINPPGGQEIDNGSTFVQLNANENPSNEFCANNNNWWIE